MKTNRTAEESHRIADELMDCCPDDLEPDHQAIADAILRGETREFILSMEETNAYPDTYHWLENELPEDE